MMSFDNVPTSHIIKKASHTNEFPTFILYVLIWHQIQIAYEHVVIMEQIKQGDSKELLHIYCCTILHYTRAVTI